MDKRQIIIELFSGSPETWTAEQLETIESKTGENISRDALRRAYNVHKSRLYRKVSESLNEAIQDARGADFNSRLYLLCTEIIPALETLEALRQIINQETKTGPENGPED